MFKFQFVFESKMLPGESEPYKGAEYLIVFQNSFSNSEYDLLVFPLSEDKTDFEYFLKVLADWVNNKTLYIPLEPFMFCSIGWGIL